MGDKLQKIKEIVRDKMKEARTSHDFSLCFLIAKYEDNVNIEVLKIAALLHDIARIKEDMDDTGEIDHALLSAKIAENILKELNFPENKIERIRHCIIAYTFKGNHKPEQLRRRSYLMRIN